MKPLLVGAGIAGLIYLGSRILKKRVVAAQTEAALTEEVQTVEPNVTSPIIPGDVPPEVLTQPEQIDSTYVEPQIESADYLALNVSLPASGVTLGRSKKMYR